MPMKTNTPLNPETQARIHQLKPSVGWHVEPFRVVWMCDAGSAAAIRRRVSSTIHVMDANG